MDKDIRHEWEKLKAAIDEYRNNTGFEVRMHLFILLLNYLMLSWCFKNNTLLKVQKQYWF